MKKTLLTIASIFSLATTQAQTQFFGITNSGGNNDAGTIFKTDGSGTNLTKQFNFTQIEGEEPQYTNLLQATDGKLYGLTKNGGLNYDGVLFQYNPTTNVYVKKVDFKALLNGAEPQGSLMQATDGNLYGMTRLGGANNLGVLFQYNPITNILTNKIDFNGAINGANPFGSLIQATDGFLYGLTSRGGTNNQGVIFKYAIATNTLTNVFNFATATGSQPRGTLLQATDGNLYGATIVGGANGFGTLFQYNLTTNTYTNTFDFDGTANGRTPRTGTLIQATDGLLYGLAEQGGANNSGVLFQYNITTAAFVKKFDFDATTSGQYPANALFQATDGKLYSTTKSGGPNNTGSLFNYNITTNSVTVNSFFLGPNDAAGSSGGVMQASNGKLYGLAAQGGLPNLGVLYEFNITTNTYSTVVAFGESTTGKWSQGSLMKASNGKLYGTTYRGGINNAGVLFEYDATTNTQIVKFNFDITSTGLNPKGKLIQASNGLLYGMTSIGGANNSGTLFQYNTVTNVYSKLFDFDAISGNSPNGSLLQAADGNLYGLTVNGGVNNFGALFQYNISTNTIIKKIDFDATSGINPYGDLIQATDGYLYGLCVSGGTNNNGTLFQYDYVTDVFTKKIDFLSATTGAYPYGSLTQAANGNLYGLNYGGGTTSKGTIFEYNPTTVTCTATYHFLGFPNGERPRSNFLKATDGNLYSICNDGANNYEAMIFQYNPTTSTFTKTVDFAAGDGYVYFNGLLEIPVTIATSTIATTYCVGNTVNVPYVLEGAYNANNVFTAELSNASGLFTTPTTIGTYSSNLAGAITATIPAVAQSALYRVRVVSSSQPIVGTDNGTNITVNTLPTVSVTSGAICAGQSFTITPSGASTYTYLSGTAIVSPTANASYSVTGTSSLGCVSSNTAISSVTVNALPTILAATNNTIICVGQTSNLTASGATSYTWNTTSTNTVIVVTPTTTTSYTVMGTNANGCTNMAMVTQSVSACAGIDNSQFVTQNSEIVLYPNPTNGILNVELGMLYEGNATIEITNALGQVVLTENVTATNTTLKTNNLDNGIYFVRVISNNRVITTQKIVKQ